MYYKKGVEGPIRSSVQMVPSCRERWVKVLTFDTVGLMLGVFTMTGKKHGNHIHKKFHGAILEIVV